MTKKYAILKSAFVTLMFAGLGLTSQAQKLKSVQEGSMRAPSNLKIDGKLTEWDDTFKAYNNTTDIFYTVSNDDNDLYLTIKAGTQWISNKVLAGGINFAINTADKKKEEGAYTVVFPLIDMANIRDQMQQMGGQRRVSVNGNAVTVTATAPAGGGGGTFSAANGGMDSATIASMRKRALATVREIKLINFSQTELPDSVISIYNEYGFKGAVDFDGKGMLTCEMAIPLKYLHMSVQDAKEFSYNIKLNGLNISSMMPRGVNMTMGGGMGGMGGGMGGGGGQQITVVRRDGAGNETVTQGSPGQMPPGMPSMNDMMNMVTPTDFWGKYTLAKK